MGLFSKKPKRNATASTEAWSSEKWRGLVKSVSMSAEMYCEKYASEMAQARSNAANLLAEGFEERARNAAEQALRNRAKVRALSRLTVLASHLHARESRIDGLSTLEDAHEPARTELVSLVYASGRLNVQPLAGAVALLRSRFPDDVEDIVRGKGNWPTYFDTRLYDALTPGPADEDLVDAELAAAAKEFAAAAEQGQRVSQDARDSPTARVAAARAHSAQLGAPPVQVHPATVFAPGAPASKLFSAAPLPKPWEGGGAAARTRARAPSGLRGAALAPAPPPPPGSAAERVPDYALRFTDSDEVVLMRYRDLRA